MWSRLWSVLRPALVTVALSTLLLGLAYPLGLTALAALTVPERAGGSLVVVDGHVVGAFDVGQHFAGDQWLQGRPSATPTMPYNAASSSGSNLGPAHPALRERLAATVVAGRTANAAAMPIDLVTTSASGLDPHVSPAAARWQVERIARARGLSPLVVQGAVDDATEDRFLGLFGEPRVRVLAVNLALAKATR